MAFYLKDYFWLKRLKLISTLTEVKINMLILTTLSLFKDNIGF